MTDDMEPLPEDLNLAGTMIDKAVEHLIGQKVNGMAIASALLGGALGLMARSMSDDAIAHVLNNALASVRSGELRRMGH